MKENANSLNDSDDEINLPDPQEEKGLNEDLLNEKQQIINKKSSMFFSIFSSIFPCFQKVDTVSKRKVYLNNPALNVTNWINKEENNKYNIFTFLPIVLFNQFKQFGNLFYLLMSISQFFPDLKVGFLFTYISPLSFVVCVSMAKEAIDDISRRVQDKKTNSGKVQVLILSPESKKVESIEKPASDLKIGDIIELQQNCRVPADIIVLKTFNDSKDNQAFIRTDQLDGETDWKLRKAPGITQEMEELHFFQSNAYALCNPPSKLIYEFEGAIYFGKKKEALNLENTMWASTVVASKKVIGLVIYTGKETRARMNSSSPKMKIGVLDQELNKSNKYLFFIMLILSSIMASAKGFDSNFFYNLIKYIVLFCAIISISLRVNLDISKTYFSYVINRDPSIPETIARNSMIPEELGRISYVFSDKTGTLTKNEMIFKKLALESEQYSEERLYELKEILSDECKQYNAPLLDILTLRLKNQNDQIQENLLDQTLKTNANKIRRQKKRIIRDAISSMVLCNNVTPVFEDDQKTKVTYQASSPDEVALVKFAETLDMRLFNRTDKEITIKDTAGNIEEFEVLANFPFSSDTKRMGIILKNKTHGHIIFYLKGAENVMMKRVMKEYEYFIKENAENLATKGLRTLVLTQKLISQDEFNKWYEDYSQALTSMENRKEKIQNVVSKLEHNMEFLCVTGVEDLLQDEVAITIDNLRNAGMKTWILTGDKVETETCISI